jgi:large subunit ribosomal protein L15
MVIRHEKRKRKYFGTRRWGVGNIKNARGAGDRGGVGKGGRKHKWTLITAHFPETIKKKGFTRWGSSNDGQKEINMDGISAMVSKSGSQTLDLSNYKVLSNGTIQQKVTVKAYAFSKKAAEKIKKAGGEAISVRKVPEPKPAAATTKIQAK